MSKKIEGKVSITAQGTCLMRATSYYEKDPQYKSEDFIASMIIPSFLKTIAKYNILRTILKRVLFKVPGIYEYVISRTKFIDDICNNLVPNIDQVLILGAGFDSRAIRFREQLKSAKVFELDAPVTQKAKINQFMESHIDFPPNLSFISIDFNKELLVEKLDEAGFQKKRTCLFLLEGLTYYLNQEAIDHTLHIISDYAATDSLLVFDYASASAVRQERGNGDSKNEKHYRALAKAGENPGFMLEGKIQEFLKKYNFELIEEVNSAQLAERYFKKNDFESAAQKFRIITARKTV